MVPRRTGPESPHLSQIDSIVAENEAACLQFKFSPPSPTTSECSEPHSDGFSEGLFTSSSRPGDALLSLQLVNYFWMSQLVMPASKSLIGI